jgi:nucleoside-diphosphate-sugar epimerase
LKALSEQEAAKWFPAKTLIIRPGLIVGPGDPSDRFTYWPVRIDRAGEVLAPGNPNDPVQFIDVRDLAERVVRMAENQETGTYNATGPASTLGIGAMLNGIKEAVKSNAKFTWVSGDFLKDKNIQPWTDMPVWTGSGSGFAKVNNSRALKKALTFRPLAETARETLEWFKSLPADTQSKMKAGLTPAREAEVLAAWKQTKVFNSTNGIRRDNT